MKEIVAKELAKRVKDGDVIGVGTGTTVEAALTEIGKRVKAEGLHITVVPTSYQSAWQCQDLGFVVMYPGYRGQLSWGFDGADQVNKARWAIKGRGGAMLQEKILAKRCKEFVIIVDETKVVSELGRGCPIPVEVVPESLSLVDDALKSLGAREAIVRVGTGKHGPVITERGNIIIDATFPVVTERLEGDIKALVGVVDSGLFIGYASEVLVAGAKGVYSL